MDTKETILHMLDTEFIHEISDIKDTMNNDSEGIKYLYQLELSLLKLANHMIKQNYERFKELPESLLLSPYEPMGIRSSNLGTFIHGVVVELSASLEDILSNCYLEGYNLNIDLNKLILDSMQNTYAQLLK